MEPIFGGGNPRAPAGLNGATPPQGGADIVDAGTADFMAEVVEASMQRPVLVDFWAPWCGPCKAITPVLEKAVTQAQGQVKLVKVNIDENPEIAQQMRIQSIPAVFAFAGGRPIDGFVGQVPESQIKEFIARVVQAAGGQVGPSPAEEMLAQAQAAAEAGDAAGAAGLFANVLEDEPDNVAALAGLADAYLTLGEAEAAGEVLAQVPADKADDPAVAKARARLDLAGKADEATARLEPLRQAVAADPDDFESRLALAEALFHADDAEGASDQLLYIIEKRRDWNDEAARKQLLKFFDAWGPMDPRTLAARRRLSSLLFS